MKTFKTYGIMWTEHILPSSAWGIALGTTSSLSTLLHNHGSNKEEQGTVQSKKWLSLGLMQNDKTRLKETSKVELMTWYEIQITKKY